MKFMINVPKMSKLKVSLFVHYIEKVKDDEVTEKEIEKQKLLA